MFEVNDALVQQIIRTSHDANPAHRGAYHATSHPLNTRPVGPISLPSPAMLAAALATGLRADFDRIAARTAPKPSADPACCPAAV